MRALLTGLAAFVMLAGHSAYADDRADGFHASAPDQGKQEGRTMNEEVVQFIAEAFGLNVDYVKERWAHDPKNDVDSLPLAIDDMLKGDDKRIAKLIAQLMGTANPTLAQKAFETARKKMLEMKNKAEPYKEPLPSFVERVLFGIYDWPKTKNKAQAFCEAAVDQLANAKDTDKRSLTDASQRDTWEHFEPTYLQHIVGVKEPSKATDADKGSMQSKVEEECFKKEPSLAKFTKFHDAFDKAADEVYNANLAFHKAKDAFANDKATPEEKKAAVAAISDKWNDKALASYAQQQANNEWKVDGVNKSEANAASTYQVMAWKQAGNMPSRNLSLVAKGDDGKEKVVEISWPPQSEPKAIMAEAKKAFAAQGIDPATRPYVRYNADAARIAQIKELAQNAAAEAAALQAAEAEKQRLAAEEAAKRKAAEAAGQQGQQNQPRAVAFDKTTKAGAVTSEKCLSCHNGEKSQSDRFKLQVDASGNITGAQIAPGATFATALGKSKDSMGGALETLAGEDRAAIETLLGN